jgi:hypothetical protein
LNVFAGSDGKKAFYNLFFETFRAASMVGLNVLQLMNDNTAGETLTIPLL